MAWKMWYPSMVVIKNANHIWVTSAGKLYSFNEVTQFFRLPFYTLLNSKIVVFTSVENGGITTRIVDSSGNIEAEQYVEGEGKETTLQIEVEVTNTTGALRYFEIEGIPDGGFTESIYDLVVLLVTEGGGWRLLKVTAGGGWTLLTPTAGSGWRLL